jgi:hypothetical protein
LSVWEHFHLRLSNSPLAWSWKWWKSQKSPKTVEKRNDHNLAENSDSPRIFAQNQFS